MTGSCSHLAPGAPVAQPPSEHRPGRGGRNCRTHDVSINLLQCVVSRRGHRLHVDRAVGQRNGLPHEARVRLRISSLLDSYLDMAPPRVKYVVRGGTVGS